MEVRELLLSWYSGCGRESEMMELLSILSQVSEGYHAGEITDEEVVKVCRDLCVGITNTLKKCGKVLSRDKCVEDLKNAVEESVDLGALKRLVYGLRSKRRSSSSGATLLP